jgi:hypothetical protein
MSTPNIPLTLNRDALPISASVNDILIKYTSALAEIQRLLAEVDRLRADRDCEKRIRKDAEELRENAIARAERAEAAETVALAKWNGALERAMKAEADLIALEQCHDDNCRAVVKLADDLSTEREKAERYRLASLKLEAELADWSVLNAWGGTPEIIHKFVKGQQARIHYCQNIEADLAAEQARLDAGAILLTVAGERVLHCGVDLRAAIDAGVKESAK